ncbi:MAG: PHP domain-containing protein [Verrucomicrobiota bacterium]
MIDLHSHSTFSDGELSPGELLALAGKRGLRALALTDHDTTEGLAELERAKIDGVERVPGVEVSAMLGADTIHVVGLFIRPNTEILQNLLHKIRSSRDERNSKILRRLRFLGCPVDEPQLRACAGHGVMGRPHIARSLVAAGACSSIREAFNNFLGCRGKAYVKRYRPSVQTAIEAIHTAGGVAVWAHPVGGRDLSESVLRARLQSLRDCGLDAVESHYSDHSPEQRRTVEALAGDAGLLLSGGSDFHGETMPGIDLAVGRGDLNVPDQFLLHLRARAHEIAAAQNP